MTAPVDVLAVVTPDGWSEEAWASEQQYRNSERDLRSRWDRITPESREAFQLDGMRMPGWLNAPSWAEWLQFCRTRGWMFVSEQPHVYSDGDMTADVGRMQPASEVPGVIFFRNDRKYSGSSAPHWVCDRRAALARVGGAA